MGDVGSIQHFFIMNISDDHKYSLLRVHRRRERCERYMVKGAF